MLYSLPEGSHQKHGENDGKPWESGSEAVAKSDIYTVYMLFGKISPMKLGIFQAGGPSLIGK